MTTRLKAALIVNMALVVTFGYPCFAANKAKKKTTKTTPAQVIQVAPAPAPVDVGRETSIDRIIVGVFRANVADKKLYDLWNQRKLEYQQNLVAILNERSYLEAVPVNRELTLSEGRDIISNEAQRDGVDGALVGEFRGKSIELAIRSAATGRTLARMTVPMGDLEGQAAKDVSQQVVDQVVLSFPYRGFVVARKDNEVKLNLGRAQGIKVGTLLEIDEFEGDAPNFSSKLNKVGIVKVTKLANNAAIGLISESIKPIRPYAKVSFTKGDDKALDEQLSTRYHRGLFFSLGSEFYYIDTQVSNTNIASPLAKRIYQIPLSPALGVGLGYYRLAMMALVSGLSNSSNTVSLLSGTATFELIRHPVKQLNFITSVGGYYASYQSTPVATGLFPLDSVTTYSGLLEERIQYITSPQTKLFGSARLYIPVFSKDQDNGSSSPAKSFGGGFDFGIRMDLSKIFALEGGLQSRDIYVTLQSGDTINEFEYGFFAHLLFRL